MPLNETGRPDLAIGSAPEIRNRTTRHYARRLREEQTGELVAPEPLGCWATSPEPDRPPILESAATTRARAAIADMRERGVSDQRIAAALRLDAASARAWGLQLPALPPLLAQGAPR